MKRFFFWKRPDDAPGQPAGDDDVDAAGLLTGDRQQDAQSLEILLDSIAEVNSNIDLDRVLEDIVARSLEVTRAERAIVLLGSSAEDLKVRIARDREGGGLPDDSVFSKTLVKACLEEGHPQRSVVRSDQEALELGQSVYNLKLRAVMCAPLRARERTVGVIYVDSTAMRREFSSRDLALFGALSSQLAIALENARLHGDSLEKARMAKDFEIAKQIQKHLLAPVRNDYEGAQVAVRFRARDEASGDTYDIVTLSNGRLVALVGDVTGHGVGAALLTHAAQAAVRSYLELIDDLSQVATRLNDRLVASVETGNFMSMVLILVDSKAKTMHYVNAGHPGVMLVRGGKVRELEKTGMVFGVVGGQQYDAAGPVDLEDRDLLFLRTDGVDETMNPDRELFGTERLVAVLSDCGDCSADQVLLRVERATVEHARGVSQDDDLTMVAVRINAS